MIYNFTSLSLFGWDKNLYFGEKNVIVFFCYVIKYKDKIIKYHNKMLVEVWKPFVHKKQNNKPYLVSNSDILR